MYQISYIILAHKNPHQVCRLIENLCDENVYFYVHIDKNVSFNNLIRSLTKPDSVKIIDSIACSWGDFSLVEATLRCIEQVILDNRKGHTVLLSGQDFPIWNNKRIRAYLEDNRNYNFIDCLPVKDVWPNHYKYRTQAYKYNYYGNKSDYVFIPTIFSFRPKAIYRNAKKILLRSIIDKDASHLRALKNIFLYKAPPKDIIFYGGSQWWVINESTLQKIFRYVNYTPDFVYFFKNAVIPDEVFFQTALMRLKIDNEDILLKPSLTYTYWNSRADDSPQILTSLHYDAINEASKRFLFARKFDTNVDASILNLIETKRQSE